MASATAAPWRSLLLVYIALLVGAVLAFFAIRQAGLQLETEAIVVKTVVPAAAKPPTVDVVLHVLATLAAIIALGHGLARAFRWIGQPAVIGEVVAGIALGPSLLGTISPEAMQWLIPGPTMDPHGQVLAALKAIAQLGVVLYMFLIGLELNLGKVGRQAHAAIAISHASIVFPFVLGAALALWLYPGLSQPSVSFTSFALFLGAAMSITAFPVLARILTDRHLDKTDLGVVALSCAATDDVTAWCLLAFVVGVAKAQVSGALLVIVAAVAFIAVMFLVVRPLLTRWMARIESELTNPATTSLLFIAVLCAAWTTEAIGIHAVFGSFLLGAMMPHDSRIARELRHKLHDVVTTLLLPAFFAVTGMNTQIGLIHGIENWLICLAIIAVATLGKFGGTLAAARFTGLPWRTASALGVLMNTRGLMELIVLNIGLSLGVISDRLFAMMVLMALATTMATAPILSRLVPGERDASLA